MAMRSSVHHINQETSHKTQETCAVHTAVRNCGNPAELVPGVMTDPGRSLPARTHSSRQTQADIGAVRAACQATGYD